MPVLVLLLRNAARFSQDPLQRGAESVATFHMMEDILRKHKPARFVLENVMGAKPAT